MKQTNENPLNRAADLRKALRDILIPMDILVYTPSEIEKDKERKFTFIHDVLNSGKVLYAINNIGIIPADATEKIVKWRNGENRFAIFRFLKKRIHPT